MAATAVAMVLGTAPVWHAAAVTTHVAGDFNGDGYPDLAIGASADPDGTGFPSGVGSVSVVYGSARGLNAPTSTRFDPLTAGMPAALAACMQPRLDITFGFAVATGDFNGDGYADLAIGVPSCWTSDSTDPGGVLVLWGSPAGLTTASSTWLPSPSSPTSVASTGFSLAAGDFNHDGYTDLAAGSPFDDTGSATRAGSIAIWSGGPTGLTLTKVFSGASAGMPGPAPASGDALGFSLAAGDFKHDGFTDLAAAEPGKSGVVVLYGGAGGLTTAKAQYLQNLGPYGGQAIIAADFTGTGYADLAVGDSCAVHTAPNRGVVEVHYGTKSGLGSVGFDTAQQLWVTASGMPRFSGQAPQYFGLSLSAGDFNGDHRADLAVGTGSGVYVVRGGSKHLTTTNSQLLADGTSEQALGTAPFNGGAFSELAVGFAAVPSTAAPRVDIHAGSTAGVVMAPSEALYQGPSGVVTAPGSSSVLDSFGQSLSPPGTSGVNNRFCEAP